MFLHSSLFRFFGSAGELIVGGTLVLLAVLRLSRVTIRGVVRCGRRVIDIPVALGKAGLVKLEAAYRANREERSRHYERAYASNVPEEPAGLSELDLKDGRMSLPEEEVQGSGPARNPLWERISLSSIFAGKPKKPPTKSRSDFLPEDFHEDEDADDGAPHLWRSLPVVPPVISPNAAYHSERDLQRAIDEYFEEEIATSRTRRPSVKRAAEPPVQAAARPIKVSRRADEELSRTTKREIGETKGDDYKLPPLDLLDTPPASTRSVDEKVLEDNAAILEQKLADLGIRGNVVEIHPGPVITMYELTLAPGIPLRKVLSTSDDLAMALKSGSTRVVAPIHGKDTVGIEVPNLNREIVHFREIIGSPAFVDLKAPLKVALGKGIDGHPYATSLGRMPHLLIAGATGTGKSVGLNCLICSWLMSCHPDDVKFLMVDPKRLELSYYQDIPHLIHPVVTESEKVPKVLSWAIREMERRYELLSATGAKNIESYNQTVLEQRSDPEAEEPRPEKLPYIIIIVDELAELMMVAAKDIEISIARLAQMARAAGIHLILATQRPSVDVITGVIKANFPARLSFQVSAKPDSRTILDTTGAEHLLGMGDMLFLPPGASKLVRLHGAYVSEQEIRNIVDFIKVQRSPVYLKEIEKHVSEEDARGVTAEMLDDVKYDEAVELVTRLGHASISLIQRHMRIGYNRAARIIECMETEGLIGPSDGTSRPREVLGRSLASIPDR
ncbi:MAG: DNA translocase FtsK [Desulfomonile tiedjei]|nr:DNA translocase FtsK [Desulfomonile tiedjei]